MNNNSREKTQQQNAGSNHGMAQDKKLPEPKETPPMPKVIPPKAR